MPAQIRELLRKEWHERRMQFLICMLWMVCGTLYCIAYEWSREFRASVASFYSTAMSFGMLMPIFLAMRTALGETTDRTRSFSDALPISSRRRAWIRLAGGAGVLIVPILTAAVLLSLCLACGWLRQSPTRPPDGPGYTSLSQRVSLSATSAVGLVWQVTAVVLWATTTLYVLLSLIGTTLRKEAHAGFVGTVVVFLWFLGECLGPALEEFHLPGSQLFLRAMVPPAMIIDYGYGETRGSYGDLAISDVVFAPLLVNTLLQFALAMWFVRRYSRKPSGRPATQISKAPRTTWRPWSLPLPTRSVALIWLTLRQSVPMCIPGLLLACLMTFFQMRGPGLREHEEFFRRYTDSMSSSMWAIGLMWAVVVGAGVFSAEIDSRIGEFWRTWPVAFWRLFAIKFFIGLLAVLLVLDGTTIAASWNSPNWGDYYAMNWPYIACFVPLHATMFAVAVAWACLLRRPVLGGMAAAGSFTMMSLGLEWWDATRQFEPIEVYNNLARETPTPHGPIDFTAHGYPILVAAMGLILLACIVIAGLALRRYDPRRLAA
jgi:hypothetical protein